MMALEQELKFRILNTSSIEEFKRVSFWSDQGYQMDRVEQVPMFSRYYDTVDRILSAHGISLRVRREGYLTVITVKCPPNGGERSGRSTGYATRLEWEQVLDPSRAGCLERAHAKFDHVNEEEELAVSFLYSLQSELSAVLDAIPRNLKFKLMYEAIFDRWRANLSKGQTDIEIAIDSGSLHGSYHTEDMNELEFELKQGSVEDLETLSRILQNRSDIEVEKRSKAKRLTEYSTADCIIVGAGASGLMAALSYRIRREAGQLLLLEAQDVVGRKLSASGNERGSVSHIGLTARNYHQVAELPSPELIDKQLASWSPEALCAFLESIGLLCRLEENRVYPFSMQAKSVTKVLEQALLRYERTDVRRRCKVTAIKQSGEADRSRSFQVELENGEILFSRKLILSSGGKSYPKLGADRSGYDLAVSLGHETTLLFPGLVQIVTKGLPSRMSGQRIQAGCSVYVSNKLVKREYGEILFTDYGLSGIPILNISHVVSQALTDGLDVQVVLHLLDGLDAGQLLSALNRLRTVHPTLSVQTFLQGYFSDKIALSISSLLEIEAETKIADLDPDVPEKIQNFCQHLVVRVTATKGFDFAQVTCGGVYCSQVEPLNLLSKRCPDLYLCGEILDIHGDFGGYNLHFAFVSGRNAGRAAADHLDMPHGRGVQLIDV